jgi:peptidyl-tRNA hydrolase
MRFRESRPQLEGPPKAGGGIRRLSRILQGRTETAVRFGKIRVECEGSAQACRGTRKITAIVACVTQIKVRFGVRRQ